MTNFFRRLGAALALTLALTPTARAQVTIPNTLVAGATIRASDLNTNFSTLGNHAFDRLTGGNVSGNITLDPGLTIDGIDLSVALCSSCAASFNSLALTTTAAVGTTLTVGTNLTLTAPSTGVTVAGVNIINSSGKIPALTTAFFSSLAFDGSNISAGLVAPARLGSGTPSATSYLRGDSTWQRSGILSQSVSTGTNYSAVAGDFVLVSAVATVTLPAAASNDGTLIEVKMSGSGYTVTIARSGSDTIDGQTTQSIIRQYDALSFVSAGGNWWIR